MACMIPRGNWDFDPRPRCPGRIVFVIPRTKIRMPPRDHNDLILYKLLVLEGSRRLVALRAEAWVLAGAIVAATPAHDAHHTILGALPTTKGCLTALQDTSWIFAAMIVTTVTAHNVDRAILRVLPAMQCRLVSL